MTGRSRGVSVSRQPVMGIPVELVGPEERQQAIDRIKSEFPNLVVIDYTLPSAVNGERSGDNGRRVAMQPADHLPVLPATDNAKFYCDNQIPFVMGTTGGDRDRLLRDVQGSGAYAVIAPQMGKQIVAFQAMMEYMGSNFPGAFAGYTLEVRRLMTRLG